MNDYLTSLKKYATFSGRATRKEFWMFILINCIVVIVLTFIDIMLGLFDPRIGIGLLGSLYILATLLPYLAVQVRRLHDTSRSGWWVLISLIPLIGSIVLLVFLVQDSKEDNQYGPNPKRLV